ncbi:MAG: universal stress protein, partial [Acidimicrobiales bacterium]
MKLQTLVVGFDGSVDALEALDTAIQLAGDESVVHVVTAYHYPSDQEIADLIATLPDEYAADFDRIAVPRQHLRQAERALEGAGIDHKGYLVEGEPAGVILDIAESTNANLVVVGSRGLGR